MQDYMITILIFTRWYSKFFKKHQFAAFLKSIKFALQNFGSIGGFQLGLSIKSLAPVKRNKSNKATRCILNSKSKPQLKCSISFFLV